MFDVRRSWFEGETELLLNGTNCLYINDEGGTGHLEILKLIKVYVIFNMSSLFTVLRISNCTLLDHNIHF